MIIQPDCLECGNDKPTFEEMSQDSACRSEGFYCEECGANLVVEFDIKYEETDKGFLPYFVYVETKVFPKADFAQPWELNKEPEWAEPEKKGWEA